MADGPREGGDARADLAEAVTLVTRAVGTALDSVGQVVGDTMSQLFGGTGGGRAPATEVVPEVRPLFPVAAGDEVTTRVSLSNHADAASEPFGLAATDLVSDAGDSIPADAVSAGAEQRVVAAHTTDTVQVSVSIPGDAKPGVYKGELRPGDESVPPAQLVVEVR
jgi:hypothetical protein